MGYFRHRVAVAVQFYYGFPDCNAEKINIFIEELEKKLKEKKLPCLILKSEKLINGWRSYVFSPDGSKMGWNQSNECQRLREMFIKNMRKFGCDVLYAEFGGDDPHDAVIDYRGKLHYFLEDKPVL